MNYMSEVAKLLGVELGEEFDVCFDNSNIYMKAKLTENGFRVNDTNMIALTSNSTQQVFEWILCGTVTIKRKPWKPKYGDVYYCVSSSGYVVDEQWYDDIIDKLHYKISNCYQQESQAEANRDRWITFYASDEVLEV